MKTRASFPAKPESCVCACCSHLPYISSKTFATARIGDRPDPESRRRRGDRNRRRLADEVSVFGQRKAIGI